MRIDLHTRVRAVQPDLVDQRGDKYLLVWSGFGQWVCGDEELVTVVRKLDGSTSVLELIGQLEAARGLPRDQLAASLAFVLEALAQRGILGGAVEPVTPDGMRLFNVTLNITNRCNLSCAWCYNHRDWPTGHDLEADVWVSGLRRIRALGSQRATLFILGGEPLVEFDRLQRLVEGVGPDWQLPIQVTTNGTLIEREHARALARLGVEVQVSIDGGSAEQHESIRGAGSFVRAVRGIRQLLDHGARTVVSMVYSRRSITRLESFLDLARELGVPCARFIPLRGIGRGRGFHGELPDQLEAFRTALDVLDRRPELRPLLGRDYFSILLATCAMGSLHGACGVGREVLFIDADGTVYPCPNHVAKGYAVGSLVDPDIVQRLQRSTLLGGLRRRRSIERLPWCKPCVFRRWCGGDCRGEVLAAGGDPSGPSAHCSELKKVYLEALWLLAVGDNRFPKAAEAVREKGCF